MKKILPVLLSLIVVSALAQTPDSQPQQQQPGKKVPLAQPGFKPNQPQVGAIARLKSARDLAPLVARLQLGPGARRMLFAGGSSQDPDNSEQDSAVIDQGGLGLPVRDYYAKGDPKS